MAIKGLCSLQSIKRYYWVVLVVNFNPSKEVSSI